MSLRAWAIPALLVSTLLVGCTTTTTTTATSTNSASTSSASASAGGPTTASATTSGRPTSGSATSTAFPSATVSASATSAPEEGTSGLDTCDLATLPPEAADTIDDIEAGGPFVARKDGSTFGNRERLLPNRRNGFYREYTVPTPGSRDRGARRIVTGGDPAMDPEWLFYTDDHYASFCEVTGH